MMLVMMVVMMLGIVMVMMMVMMMLVIMVLGIGLTAVTTYDDEYDDTLGFCTKSSANLDLSSQANHWATDSFLLKYLAQNQHGNSSR